MDTKEMTEAILKLQQEVARLHKIITDMGYDTESGEYSNIIYTGSTEEVRNHIDQIRKGVGTNE